MSSQDFDRVRAVRPSVYSSHQSGRTESLSSSAGGGVRFDPSRAGVNTPGLIFGSSMADSYKEFSKSDTAPIVPEIRIRHYSFRVRELILGVISLVALVGCVVLIAVVASNSSSSDDSNTSGLTAAQTAKNNICLDYPCLRAASYAVSNMNQSVKPCEDFYKYACGNYPSQNPLDPDTPQRTVYWNMYYENEDRLRTLLESPPARTSSWSSEKKLKDFFMSCVDDYGKMNAGGKTFIDKIVTPLGGWDVLNTFDSANFNLQQNLQKTSVDFWTAALFTFRVTTDKYDVSNRVIEIDMSGMGMLWTYFTRPENQQTRDDYKKFMRTVAQLLARDSELTLDPNVLANKINTFVNDVFDLEMQLANITAYTLPTGNPHHQDRRITLADLTQQTANVVDFVSFFTYVFGDVVNANTRVIVMEDDWVRRMLAMVNALPAADKNRTLSNYIIWRLARRYAQELSYNYIHANRVFYTDMWGQQDFWGDWHHCFWHAQHNMQDALGSLYAKQHFADNNKAKAEEIVTYVKKSVLASIDKNKIMDDVTKAAAKTKINAATDKMGYPEFYMRDAELDNIYQSLSINRSDYFQNLLNLNQFEKSDWTRRLRTGEDRNEWLYNSYDTTMTFYMTWNQLLVPAGLLQFPVYEWTLPHYYNFGTMGTLVGHYMTHAIDSWGSFYDENGAYSSWWSNGTARTYANASQCYAEVYGNRTMGPYRVHGQAAPQSIPVNGRAFSWEGMAETSGIRISYEAYKLWVSENGEEKLAPSLHYTTDQSFFLSVAQANCFNRNDDLGYYYAQIQRVPEDVRINTALSLLPQFSSAFGCPVDSPMNSKTKCDMW